MVKLALFSLLFGLLLSRRCSVFGLLLAIGLIVVVIVINGVAREVGGWSLAVEVVTVATALEIGFLVGSVVSSVIDNRFRRGLGPTMAATKCGVLLLEGRGWLHANRIDAELPGSPGKESVD
jgi:hypothetical protein